MRIYAFLGLLGALVLATAVLPASAQQDPFKSVKDKLEENKKISEQLLKNAEEIIARIKSASQEEVEKFFNGAMGETEKVIKRYDEGSDLAKALDEADAIIKRQLDNAKVKAKEAPALWQEEVDGWKAAQENAIRQRGELKRTLQEARSGLETMQQNKELLMSRIARAGIAGAQALIDRSLSDFKTLSSNMKDVIKVPGKALPGGGT